MNNTAPRPETAARVMPIVSETEQLYEVRHKVYPRAVTGVFARWRWSMVFLTQLIFYGLVWLPWNGRQAVLFHLAERKFYLVGWVFWPQDVFYLTVLLIVSAYSLFLFTAVAGRLWCGYACPQTVYTEIFLWIERRIEGDRAKRMKLDQSSASLRKILTKGAKFLAWGLVALWTGVTFVGYFSPIRELLANLPFSLSGWETFWIMFYSGFTFLMAGFMREQVCKYMCPYARFQGVMFDPDTLVITYDPERGEPRGAKRKGVSEKLGDCVDCGICVQVCPTGIDIRKGLQYECIGCAACIDACDRVMDKVGKPRGLVRYTTENALKQRWTRADMLRHVARPRVLVYSTVLLLIVLAAGWSLAHRPDLRVDVIRDRTTLAREVEDGKIENIYTLQLMNMTETPRKASITVRGLDGLNLVESAEQVLPAAGNRSVTLHVRVPADAAARGAHKVVFEIRSGDLLLEEKSSFMLP